MKEPQTIEQMLAFLKNAPAEEVTQFIDTLYLQRPELREPLMEALKSLQAK